MGVIQCVITHHPAVMELLFNFHVGWFVVWIQPIRLGQDLRAEHNRVLSKLVSNNKINRRVDVVLVLAKVSIYVAQVYI